MQTLSSLRPPRAVAMLAVLLAAFAVLLLGSPAGAVPLADTYPFNFNSIDPADGDGTGTCYSAGVMLTDDCGGAGAPPVAPGVIQFGAVYHDGTTMTQTANYGLGRIYVTAAGNDSTGPYAGYTDRIVITNTDPGVVFKSVTVYNECCALDVSYSVTATELGGTGVEQTTALMMDFTTSSFTLPGAFAFDQVVIEPEFPMHFGALDFVFEFTPSVPGAPTNVAATAGNGEATVTFDAPASDGGSAITGYTVSSSPAGGVDPHAGTTGTSHLITGLTNGVEYTFTVTATNSVGTSEASQPSNAVTPATVPGPPTNVTAVASNREATVSFSPPASDGGSAITGYTLQTDPAGAYGVHVVSATEHIVTGLTNGVGYTFTVTATNSAGTGLASQASNAVVPQATTTTTVAASSGSGLYLNSVTFTATVSAGKDLAAGTVTFYDGDTAIGTADLDGGGMASITVDDFMVGDHTISAAYSGNAATKGSTSGTLNYAVGKSSSSVAFTRETYSVPEGEPFAVEVVVSGSTGTPTGTVTFHRGESIFATVDVVNGRARYESDGGAPGNYTFEAEYSGSATLNGSMAATPATVSIHAVATTTPEPDVTSTPEPVDPAATPTVEPGEEPTQEPGGIVAGVLAGASSIVVGDASPFTVGDTIRIGAGTANEEDAVIVAIEGDTLVDAGHEPLVAAAAMSENGPTWRLHLAAPLEYGHVAGTRVVVLAAGLPSTPPETPAVPAAPSGTPAPPAAGSGIATETTTYATLIVAAMIILSLSAPALIATTKRER